MSSTIQALRNTVQLMPDLQAFCQRLAITSYVPIILDIIEESFPQFESASLSQECDPESGEEWLVIDLDVKGEIDEVSVQYNHYAEQKVARIPWPIIDKIRLSHHYAT